LRGPNKPLPPTPTDQSPASETPGDDGTLIARKRSGVDLAREQRRSRDLEVARLQHRHSGLMVKAASMPDVCILCSSPFIFYILSLLT
jgi:hypothetical protein